MMMRASVWSLLTLAACGGDGAKDGDTGATGDELSEMDAELGELIDGYETWPQTEPGIVAGSTVHGAFIQNWLNDTAKATVDAGGGASMPEGSVLVKQGYDDANGDTLKNLTVMWKTEGEWYWAQYDNTGALQSSGFALDGCVGCHEADPGQQDDGVISYDW